MQTITVTQLKRNLKTWVNHVRETREVLQVTRHGEPVVYFVSPEITARLPILTSESYTVDAFRNNMGGAIRRLRPERAVPDAVFVCDRWNTESARLGAMVKLSFVEQLGVGDATVR